MSASYKLLTTDFSTADAEYPSFQSDNGELTLRFKDWREKLITVRFQEVIAYRWEDDGNLPPELRDDQSYEVINSPWTLELPSYLPYMHHYKLCFNAAGVFDVVAKSFVAIVGN